MVMDHSIMIVCYTVLNHSTMLLESVQTASRGAADDKLLADDRQVDFKVWIRV
jgi:hypothetical protein